jgi:hypothetical protein
MIKGDQADTRDLRRTGHDAFSLFYLGFFLRVGVVDWGKTWVHRTHYDGHVFESLFIHCSSR